MSVYIRLAISILYLAIIAVFPFFTFSGWMLVLGGFILVPIASTVSIIDIVKFMNHSISLRDLLLLAGIYILSWLFVPDGGDSDRGTIGIQVLVGHIQHFFNPTSEISSIPSNIRMVATFIFLLCLCLFFFLAVSYIFKSPASIKQVL